MVKKLPGGEAEVLMIRGLHKIVKNLHIMKPKLVLVLGPPGSGKGTQCQMISKEFGFVHLSAGDLLREEKLKPNSEYGKLIDTHIKNGKIVPVEITCKLLLNAMIQSEKNKFLIDGFPRNQDNLDGYNKNISDKVDLKFMLFFDTTQDVCVERCLQRGAAGSGRSDDNMESLNKRFITYEKETRPVINYFSKKALLRTIDATNTPEKVFEEVKKLFVTFE